MMSELFDEQALREQYDIASKKEAKTSGFIEAFIALYKEMVITLSQAAQRTNMSEKKFEALAASMP